MSQRTSIEAPPSLNHFFKRPYLSCVPSSRLPRHALRFEGAKQPLWSVGVRLFLPYSCVYQPPLSPALVFPSPPLSCAIWTSLHKLSRAFLPLLPAPAPGLRSPALPLSRRQLSAWHSSDTSTSRADSSPGHRQSEKYGNPSLIQTLLHSLTQYTNNNNNAFYF